MSCPFYLRFIQHKRLVKEGVTVLVFYGEVEKAER
jgi:hypothetical protein